MSLQSLHQAERRRSDGVVRSALGAMSFYIAPLAIALFSLVALVFWNGHYQAAPDRPLRLRVIQSAAPLTPGEALEQLSGAARVYQYETRLSEDPVWFSFQLAADTGMQTAVELPSRHAVEMACWDAVSMQPIGKASKTRAEGALRVAKAGFAVTLQSPLSSVLCRASFAGPARLTAEQWTLPQLALSEEQYQRKSGLLDGGLIVLAMFVLMIAIINRDKLYVLFAVWLCLNLRVGALSAGWDVQWLGQHVPDEWLLQMRTVTIALYAIVTVEFYLNLFKDSIPQTRFAKPLAVVHWMCVLLLPAAIVLPFRNFLPFMWVVSGVGLLVMMGSLLSILTRTRSKVAFWLIAAFGVTAMSSLSEVIAAALGIRELIGVINSVTAALASSILAALAVAERMRQEHAQRLEAQAALEHTYEVMPIGLFTLDDRGQLISGNPALSHMLGADLASLAQSGWMRHFRQDAWTTLHELVHRNRNAELQVYSRDGSRRFLVKAALSQGKIEGFLQDITEQAKATEDLLFMANNDPLTKVYNRRGIEVVFNRAVADAAKGKAMALAYLDLDRFKLINDLFGHAAGDEVLKQVCERIISVLASNHQIGRVGGDEFVIVMPDTTIPLASLICQGIVSNLGKLPYRVGDKAFHVRGSIGLVEVSGGMSMKDAVSAADRACREAKDKQGEGLVVYERTAVAFHERQAELALVEQLSGDEATRNLFLEMQPIMSVKNPHDSLNFEVLLRMRGPGNSVIPAGRIIGAAEKSGLTGMIDRWVLSTTLRWIEDNLPRLERTQFVCMNLSGASLNDEHFIQDTLTVLEEYPVGARYLCIEITESVALHDLDNTRRFIDQIRSCGVRVALDDFGAGYTSFSYLKELPADVLKIDGNFVLHINAHPANVAIVEAIVKLGNNLGMKTIAEWAEDAATVKTLAEIGVDYVQGYVIARSQAPEKILEAASAANFITDAQMLALMQELRLTGDDIVDGLANVVNLKDMH
ncbi:MAG TPA: EAL domain-containing protein [Noviherbaspirillum sp.]|nr:EAL domain-containing protein [Noviherbaspirillum sp.]